MIDKNLDFKTTIHHDARIEGYLIEAENRTGKFRSEIGRNCIIWKIKRDTAPAWKQFICEMMGL